MSCQVTSLEVFRRDVFFFFNPNKNDDLHNNSTFLLIEAFCGRCGVGEKEGPQGIPDFEYFGHV
jgi:hypothetical protein